MAEDDRNVVLLVRRLRELCQHFHLVLIHADGFMKADGWGIPPRKPVSAGESNAVESWQTWLPQHFTRFYTNSAHSSAIAFVTIIVDDREKEDRVEEALLSAGWLEFAEGAASHPKEAHYQYARGHVLMPGRKDDGPLTRADATSIWKRAPFECISTLGIPLSRVRSPDDLKTKLIAPLLLAMDRRGTTSTEAAPASPVASDAPSDASRSSSRLEPPPERPDEAAGASD